jgi:hypothetical protein
MRTKAEIEGSLRLWIAYRDQAKEAAFKSTSLEEATKYLQKVFDYDIRAGMLEWVLNER